MTDIEHLKNRHVSNLHPIIVNLNQHPTYTKIFYCVCGVVLNNKLINYLIKILSKSVLLPAKVSLMILELAWLHLLEGADLWTGDLGFLQVLLFMSKSLNCACFLLWAVGVIAPTLTTSLEYCKNHEMKEVKACSELRSAALT